MLWPRSGEPLTHRSLSTPFGAPEAVQSAKGGARLRGGGLAFGAEGEIPRNGFELCLMRGAGLSGCRPPFAMEPE
jgi:hypothetical protein